MRGCTPWILFVLFSTTWLAPRPADAQPGCTELFGDEDFILEGRVGDRDVRAFIGRGAENDGADQRAVSGEFKYARTWSRGPDTLTLEGVFAPDCTIRIDERNATRQKVGTWTLRLAGDHLEGTRTDAASGNSASIVLRWVADMDCSGKGPWRAFRSDSWPMTFSYPANWQLVEDADGIEILCPTPDRLRYGGLPITLEHGSGFEPIVVDNGRKGTKAGRFFVRFPPDPWVVGDYECGESREWATKCHPTRTAWRLGMTVLHGPGGEHRLYTRHGYAGQGEPGILYLFRRDTWWVTLSSYDTPDWSDDVSYKPGPARFDGTGVTERIVRSLRPRASK